MILSCGTTNDRLLRELWTLSGEAAWSIEHMEERELFESCAFALERSANRTRGFLVVRGRRFDLRKFEGVILRLRQAWWPSDEFDLQDQVFVYHETMASWFALLDSMKCPIVNRFGLGWWLHDLAYPLELRTRLAHAVALPVSPAATDYVPQGERHWPTARGASDDVESIYRAGGRLLPAPGCGRDLLARLSKCGDAFSAWEEETGIYLSRIDFDRAGGLCVKAVEAFPLLEEEPDDLVSGIARALLQAIRPRREVGA